MQEQVHEAVEEVLQVEPPLVVPPLPDIQEQVLNMDDLTDASEEEQAPPMIAELVDQFVFPNLQNLPHFQVEEVPLEDLIAFDDLAPKQQQVELNVEADLNAEAHLDPMQQQDNLNAEVALVQIPEEQAYMAPDHQNIEAFEHVHLGFV